MRIVLLGAPGSGKGTQAKRLSAHHQIAHVSTGDLLRNAVAEGTALGNKVKAVLDAGELVSDDLVLALLRERLQESDCQRGYILDGYPRNLAQGEALESLLADLNQDLDAVLLIDVDAERLVERLTGRLTCSACGAVFNRFTNPPEQAGVCDSCGAEALEHRSDDTEETVRKRLNVYKEQTQPLVSFYERRALLRQVEGEGGLDEVSKRIQQALNV